MRIKNVKMILEDEGWLDNKLLKLRVIGEDGQSYELTHRVDNDDLLSTFDYTMQVLTNAMKEHLLEHNGKAILRHKLERIK